MSLAETINRVGGFLADNPSAGQMVPTTRSSLVGALEVRVQVGDHQVTVDEPATIGGTERGPSPVELALASLGSCQAITYRLWAAKLGIPLEEVTIVVEADYDARGLLGVDGHGRPGFTAVRVSASLKGSMPERHGELHAAVDEHCPVLDLFSAGAPVTTMLTATGAG